ncbi:unnamed protein product [Symbiodinium sp. CCMP2592]|nr:unnamed protein product [Symbiodinium sp. CCMP2592]
MSSTLIKQLEEVSAKLTDVAARIQQLTNKKKNKNKYYVHVCKEADDLSKVAEQRISLAKALVRASTVKPKAKAKAVANGTATAQSPGSAK